MLDRSLIAMVTVIFFAVPCFAQSDAAAAAARTASPGGTPDGAIIASEPLSRAQIAQLVADQGYFEIADLTQRRDGLWTCTALRGPGEQVTLTIDGSGRIAETAAQP